MTLLNNLMHYVNGFGHFIPFRSTTLGDKLKKNKLTYYTYRNLQQERETFVSIRYIYVYDQTSIRKIYFFNLEIFAKTQKTTPKTSISPQSLRIEYHSSGTYLFRILRFASIRNGLRFRPNETSTIVKHKL